MKEAQSGRGRATIKRETKPISTTGRRVRERTIVESAAGTLMFGITEEDIGALDEDEFEEVWSALGKVARARARVKKQAMETGPKEKEDESKKDDA